MGTMQFCLGAVSGVAVGVLTDGTARPMAMLIRRIKDVAFMPKEISSG